MNEQKLILIPSDISNIRIAIAGMGKMGSYHLNALQQLTIGAYEDYYKGNINEQLRKICICGVCDIIPSRLIFSEVTKTFDNVGNMLEQAEPDILIVATPPNTHRDIALAGLNCGIHTFVEKPIVTTSADLDELLVATFENGCRLMAGHIERYNPVSIKIKSLLQNVPQLVERYSFVRTQMHPSRITDDIIIDKVIHDLDLALNFFGKIRGVKVVALKRFKGKISEAKLEIAHENGIEGILFVSWLIDSETKKRQVEIVRGDHRLQGDFISKQLWVDGVEITCQVDGMIRPINNQLKDELVDFIAYAMRIECPQQIAPLLTIEETCELIRWLEYINKQVA